MNIFEKYKDFDILDIHPKIEEFLNSELGLYIYIDGISEYMFQNTYHNIQYKNIYL